MFLAAQSCYIHFMPELPEVETVRRQLSERLVGQGIVRVVYHRPNLRFPLPCALPDALAGKAFAAFQRHGKYMVAIFTDTGVAMGIHLGMSGHFIHRLPDDDTPPGPHDHVEMFLTSSARVLYHDPRRFGMIFATTVSQWRQHPLLAKLGPDPITEGLDVDMLYAKLAPRMTPIKTLLLDQHFIAGIGNIYASEALYSAGISPLRPAKSITLTEWRNLVTAIQTVLAQAIALNGSTYRDYRVLDGGVGRYQEVFKVYDKAGQKCPNCTCMEGVQRLVQAGRATYYCAIRQK